MQLFKAPITVSAMVEVSFKLNPKLEAHVDWSLQKWGSISSFCRFSSKVKTRSPGTSLVLVRVLEL